MGILHDVFFAAFKIDLCGELSVLVGVGGSYIVQEGNIIRCAVTGSVAAVAVAFGVVAENVGHTVAVSVQLCGKFWGCVLRWTAGTFSVSTSSAAAS